MNIQIIILGSVITLMGILIILFRNWIEKHFYMTSFTLLPGSETASGIMVKGGIIIFIGMFTFLFGLLF